MQGMYYGGYHMCVTIHKIQHKIRKLCLKLDIFSHTIVGRSVIADIRGPQRMNSDDLSDLLIFHLAHETQVKVFTSMK